MLVGDPCPWVAQSADAFLSKIFACSYSIAGIGVQNGNPTDHLVHRHTHRVVRGSLFICGRPDGRLTALTTLEASTCLAINQASSIQSLQGTCESITIGHNKTKLPLSKKAIFLERNRPRFLCEKILRDIDQKADFRRGSTDSTDPPPLQSNTKRSGSMAAMAQSTMKRVSSMGAMTLLPGNSIPLDVSAHRSSSALLGAYMTMNNEKKKKSQTFGQGEGIMHVINDMIKE